MFVVLSQFYGRCDAWNSIVPCISSISARVGCFIRLDLDPGEWRLWEPSFLQVRPVGRQKRAPFSLTMLFRIWSIQLGSWLAIILAAKGIVTSVLIATAGSLGALGNWLFSPLEYHPFAELLIVMVLCPCFFNIMQFWIQDSFLKRGNTPSTPYHRYGKSKPGQFDQSLQMSLLSSTRATSAGKDTISIV